MVGALVRRARVAKGLTQGELALQTGLRQTYISQVEGGEIRLPRDHNLDALGKALGISRAEFYAESGMLDDLERPAPDPALHGDIFSRFPIARLDEELRKLPVGPGQPTYGDEMRQLERLQPPARERMIRILARDFLHALRRELEREEEAALAPLDETT